jgi:hypothetical protein
VDQFFNKQDNVNLDNNQNNNIGNNGTNVPINNVNVSNSGPEGVDQISSTPRRNTVPNTIAPVKNVPNTIATSQASILRAAINTIWTYNTDNIILARLCR